MTAVLDAATRQEFRADETIVCLITGSGFKDDDAVDRMNNEDDCPLIESATLDSW